VTCSGTVLSRSVTPPSAPPPQRGGHGVSAPAKLGQAKGLYPAWQRHFAFAALRMTGLVSLASDCANGFLNLLDVILRVKAKAHKLLSDLPVTPLVGTVLRRERSNDGA
jgi:hypothetical protein